MGNHHRPQPFSAGQKADMASILSEYDADYVTEENTIAIMEALKEAGYVPGPGLGQAITEAGFDPQEIGSYGPQSQLGPPPPPPPQANDGAGINTDTLAKLMEILEQYNLEEISAEEEEALIEQLKSSELLFPGLLIDQMV